MSRPDDSAASGESAGNARIEPGPQRVVRGEAPLLDPSPIGRGIVGRVKGILARPNDSVGKTFAVALVLCLVCSVVVSAAAVLLRPMQVVNAALDRQRNIVEVAGLLEPGGDVEAAFRSVERRMVDLETGTFTERFADVDYDQYVAARDPDLSIAISADEDIAGIGRRARYAEVYLIGDSDDFRQIVLPINGLGLWSTMYGFISLEADLKTIAGLKFYDHAETPGLGGEIDNPAWQDRWKGKLAYDDAGEVRIEVVKGIADPDATDAAFRVDGLAGATLTSRGVDQLLRYWLDERGFGTFLENLGQNKA